MKVTSSTDSFELSILGYGKKNANWRERNGLRCQFSTRWRQQADTQSALLQTWEVNRLLTGLRSLWNKATNHVALTFAEPGLSVDGTIIPGNRYRLQIQLNHALTPAWNAYPDFPVEMDLTLSHGQLQEAIQDLSGQLATYPER